MKVEANIGELISDINRIGPPGKFFMNKFNIAFFGKNSHLAEEKDNPLGLEPLLECLPSARFKSRKNVVLGHRMLQG